MDQSNDLILYLLIFICKWDLLLSSA